MTTTPDEPLRDDDIETVPGYTGNTPGSVNLDPGTDADGTNLADADTTDADGTDGDSTDVTDGDSVDANGTDA